MAELVDAAEATAPAPPSTKALSPGSMRTVSIDDTPKGWKYRDWNRELEDEIRREKEAHERNIKEWEARIARQELPDHVDIPHGPFPKKISFMRVLVDVHAALCQNDPSMVTGRNHSSRKVRHPWEGRCQKVSIPTRSLQALVHH